METKEMTLEALTMLSKKYVIVTKACYRDQTWQLDFNYRGTNYIVPVQKSGYYGITEISSNRVETLHLEKYN